jgi:hypothetical protein
MTRKLLIVIATMIIPTVVGLIDIYRWIFPRGLAIKVYYDFLPQYDSLPPASRSLLYLVQEYRRLREPKANVVLP